MNPDSTRAHRSYVTNVLAILSFVTFWAIPFSPFLAMVALRRTKTTTGWARRLSVAGAVLSSVYTVAVASLVGGLTYLVFSMIVLGTAAGCVRQEPSPNQADTVHKSVPPTFAFAFDESNSRILLDTRVAPAQRRRFDIGQGSITIETIAASDGILTFQYTPEIEGGYAVYECKVPISEKPIIFEIDPSGVPGRTSFELDDCKIVKSGNLHFDN